MKPPRVFTTIVFLLLLTVTATSQANNAEILDGITPQNLDSSYETITTQYNSLITRTPPLLLRKFKQSKGKNIKRLTREQKILQKEYLSLIEQKRQIDPIHDLREDIKKLYHEYSGNQPFDERRLHAEATELAVGLFHEIRRLKKSYKSIFIPVVHNMMIDVGVRKRGACKHWAEDLLSFMRRIKREFFYIAWGEANMQKITEHNVAVIIPKGRPFADGMMVDPWRTSGKPFWIKVRNDKHYKWQQWVDYGVYY